MGRRGDREVYLDNAATSRPKPPCVADAVSTALSDLGSQGRGAHSVALATSRMVHEARSKLASFLGAPDPRDLSFQPGCTQAMNLALKGLLEPGDRVVVSSMEHNAVARPLGLLEKAGVVVEVAHADASGYVDAEVVEALVRAAPTKAVVCQHVSNVTGTVQPVEDITDVAHEAGALMIVDGAQAAGHMAVDIGAIGADAYAVSGHKGLLGPQGIGLLYLAPGVEARELIQGGTGSGSESVEQPAERPSRYESGTSNAPGIAGLGAAADWLAAEFTAVIEREGRVVDVLVEGLTAMPVRLLGPGPGVPRTPVVSFVPLPVEPDRLVFQLDDEWGIAARAGLHCAPWAHESIGTGKTGAVRLSPGWSTNDEDVAYVLEALAELVR